ncbi:carbohydrate ABC transporter permease [Blautia sp. HCP3S3_G3]|uniref:carbohydrate ABC transporter permease n=1 Tax=Blautia sp. HCP3S3_G3 TaxID=3438913 RepID=UPI003F88A0BF
MKTRKSFSRKKLITAGLLMLPAILLIGVYFIYPMVMTVYYAFTDMTLTGSSATAVHFVGLRNFQSILTDPKFPEILKNTLIFLLFSGIIGQQCFGFVIAKLMKKRRASVRKFTGFMVVLGWITPEIIAAYMFSAFFNDKGTLNIFLKLFGMQKVSWTYTYPLLSIVIANIWKGSAYSMLMFQAALDSIPDDIIESAKIDGASKFDIFKSIELPMIKGTTATTFIMVTLGTLGTFGMIYAFTGGGPGIKTTTLSVYMYKQAFGAFQVGYGMAIALILLFIGALLSLVYMRLIKANQD